MQLDNPLAFSAAAGPDGPGGGGKREICVRTPVLVGNPLLRWGKPYENEWRVNIFASRFAKVI
jgi:hypothetical protein